MDKQSVLPGQDCYFYYYSTCTRQDDCPYRHEPLALSNETECIYWKVSSVDGESSGHSVLLLRRESAPRSTAYTVTWTWGPRRGR